MLGKLALPAIRELIALGDEPTLREAVNRWLPADLAELADALSAPERVQVLRLIQPKRAAEAIAYLDLDTQQSVLTTFSEDESKFVLNEMAPDDRTALLAEMPAEQSERFINLLDPNERQIARALLEYREDSVGRLMTPDYLVVRREWTMRHVLDHIRAFGRDRETLNVIYITDENNKLVDDLRIREILLAPAARPCRRLDGSPVRQPLRHRRPQEGRRGLRQVRQDRAAGRRHPGPDGRDRDPRRRARRRRGRSHPRLPEVRRAGSARRTLHEHAASWP